MTVLAHEASAFIAELAARVRRNANRTFRRAVRSAIGYLQYDVERNSMFADLGRIYLAKAYAAKHDPDKAARALQSRSETSLTGGRLIGLDATYNDNMRRVASDWGELVDGAAALDDRDYIDFCYFDVDGHRKLGELLANRIAKVLSHARSDH
jgi:hypothetical protein